MIAIDNDRVVGNFRHRVEGVIVGALDRAFELHADRNVFRKQIFRLGAHHIRFIFPEGIVRLESHPAFVADTLALKGGFHQRKDAVVSAMEIGDGRLGFFDHLAAGIRQFIVQGHHRILADLHAHFNSLTRFKTCDACPRAFTPYSTCRTAPFLSMTKVERTMQRLVALPSTSLFCSTPYCSQTSPSASASNCTARPCLSRKAPWLMQSSMLTPRTTVSRSRNSS